MIEGYKISELNETNSISKDDLSIIIQDKKTKKFFLSTFLDVFYPVGSLYVSITDQNPSKFIGGTWIEVGNFVVKMTANYPRKNVVKSNIYFKNDSDKILKLYKRTK